LTESISHGIINEDIDLLKVIKPFLTAIAIAVSPASALAAQYDDTVTFSASAVCAELTGTQNPSEASDAQWSNYLKCVQVMHYFDTKY